MSSHLVPLARGYTKTDEDTKFVKSVKQREDNIFVELANDGEVVGYLVFDEK